MQRFIAAIFVFMCLVALISDRNSARAQQTPSTIEYGRFIRFSDAPEILFLIGEIAEGDYFELRRAMRDKPTKLIALHSPGGSVFSALQLATTLQDNGLYSYVPSGAICASACAYLYFGGTGRSVAGQLGVHQFFTASDGGSGRVDLNTGLRVAQYTTSEIIGFLNEFGTPPFVYEKMFATSGMYFFDDAELDRLSLLEDEGDFMQLISKAEDIVTGHPAAFPSFEEGRSPEVLASPEPKPASRTEAASPKPDVAESRLFERMAGVDIVGADLTSDGIRDVSLPACEQICRESRSCEAYSYVTSRSWCWPKTSGANRVVRSGVNSGIMMEKDGLTQIERQAIQLIVRFNADWSSINSEVLRKMPAYYASVVDFYGNNLSHDAVMKEKAAFISRWPVRNYRVDPESVTMSCVADVCQVETVVDWAAASPERKATSSGRSTWNLTLVERGGQLLIAAESGRVISRN